MSTRVCLARHVNDPQLRARHVKNPIIELITIVIAPLKNQKYNWTKFTSILGGVHSVLGST